MIRGIYAITPTLYDDEHDLLRRCEPLLRGGASVLQFHDKQTDRDMRLRCADALVKLCASYGVPLIVRGNVDIAQAAQANGVHLDSETTHLRSARKQLGSDALIGVSCHDSMRRAVQAVEHGADYVMFGSMYTSVSSPDAVHAPLSLIRSASMVLGVPIVAFGGINADNIGRVIAAGANATAMTSTLFNADDPETITHALTKQFAPPTLSDSEN